MRQQYLIQPDGSYLPTDHVIGPCVAYITWGQLFDALKASGHVGPRESVPSFQIDGRGITITLS